MQIQRLGKILSVRLDGGLYFMSIYESSLAVRLYGIALAESAEKCIGRKVVRESCLSVKNFLEF